MATQENYASMILLAWQGRLDFHDLITYTSGLEQNGLAALAAVLYQTWLSRSQSPYSHAVSFNLGVALMNEGDLEAAVNAFQQAIHLAPTFLAPRVNLGMAYERLGLIDKALGEWRWIAENASVENEDNRPMVVLALNHLGRVLEAQKQFKDALSVLGQSLHIDPTQADVLHHWIFLREKTCSWPVYADIAGVSETFMRQSTSALAMLSLSDDPEEQLVAARNYMARKVESRVPALANRSGYGHKKIRVAYCSSDFCLHAVSILTVQLFELHNREEFEVYGFCWSRDDGSTMRQRVINAMDHFIRIGDLSDEAAARLIREHEIDILVDLQGQTLGARPNMLAYRPAPIQITYLGHPATTGLPSIDYVIADRFLIPEEEARFYSEKPLYMPDVYQVSDRKRPEALPPRREECGLPSDGFVFCSFNNNYKTTPEMFDVWMNILKRVPGSVLWLLTDNQWAEGNLKREALARGVSADRIVFAPRVAPENYLARYKLADLFLDSFPFNAGTTANDALWMGLPVLTRSGRSFASRMAGALLTAADLPELITYDIRSYEEKAVALANNPDECRRLRAHLSRVRESGVLFDTPLFVRNLEVNFKRLAEQLGQ